MGLLFFQLSESTTDNEEETVQLREKSEDISGNHKKHDRSSTENTRREDLTTDKDEAECEVLICLFLSYSYLTNGTLF